MADATAAQGRGRNLSVISVDPAPGKKGSTIFDGREFLSKTGHELRSYLHDTLCHRTPQTLLCWDAPLTGPADPASAGTWPDFTQRLIEGFFKREFETPKGISVQPYAQCQHWTITRSLLGLPRTGPYDLEFRQLPFHLLPAPQSEQDDRASVVEIHPAVAAWLWCKDSRSKESAWNYKDPKNKKKDEVWKELWCIILKKTAFPWAGRTPENNDEFDAAVGYILGSMYGEREPHVAILGDTCTGSFLLPVVPKLKKKWCEFRSKQFRPKERGLNRC